MKPESPTVRQSGAPQAADHRRLSSNIAVRIAHVGRPSPEHIAAIILAYARREPDEAA